MLVKATQRGNYMWLRQLGEIFEVPDNLYSADWMEKVPVIAGKVVPSLNVNVGGVQPAPVVSLNVPDKAKGLFAEPAKPPEQPKLPNTPPRTPLFGQQRREP